MTLCKVMWMTEYLRSLLQHFTTPSDIPHKCNYTHMCEYLMKREVIFYQQMKLLSIMPCCQWQKNHCGVSVCGRVLRQMHPCRSNLVCYSQVLRITDED